ncbi:MAG TPA: CAP domain-containing protein [Desulfosporosinus sp.]|nr:CAP domain-containing protein [Desulfosporosinus sp.]
MIKRLLWLITLGLLISNLGCNKFWPPPFPDNTSPPQSQPQSPNEPKTTKTLQGLISLPLPLSPFFKAETADITQIEQIMVDLINEDRRKAGLGLVTWDETAAKSARQHVQEEADNGYISHWGMDGEKPQRRYTLAGGLDAVNENESVTLWLEGGFHGVSKDQLQTIVTEHESAMVNEQPPNDGHRKNILDPHHTGVGVAIAIGKYGVAMAQEFTNHYSVMTPPPLTATPSSTITLKGRIDKGYQITGIYGVWEPLPQPMSREELMQTHSYSDPSWDNLHFYAKSQSKGYYISTPAGKISARNVSVDSQGNFSVPIPLANSHALDYITVEIAPNNNPKDTFYAAQFVIKR